LKTTFSSREQYRAFWRHHPALDAEWNEYMEAYFDYDLAGEEPVLRVRVSLRAALDDSADTITDAIVGDAIRSMTHPCTFLRAERGVMNEIPPLYPDEKVAPVRAAAPSIEFEVVPGTNHFTIVFGRGADVVAERIRKAARI
jgi:hypothetical protein